MKTLTVRDLNRRTAGVLDAVERGETFELRRNGKVIAYLSRIAPPIEGKPDWKAHFDRLKRQRKSSSIDFVKELEGDRRRLRARERAMSGFE